MSKKINTQSAAASAEVAKQPEVMANMADILGETKANTKAKKAKVAQAKIATGEVKLTDREQIMVKAIGSKTLTTVDLAAELGMAGMWVAGIVASLVKKGVATTERSKEGARATLTPAGRKLAA